MNRTTATTPIDGAPSDGRVCNTVSTNPASTSSLVIESANGCLRTAVNRSPYKVHVLALDREPNELADSLAIVARDLDESHGDAYALEALGLGAHDLAPHVDRVAAHLEEHVDLLALAQ